LDHSLLAPDLARSAVHLHPDVKKSYIDARIENLSTNRSHAVMTIGGILYNETVRGSCETEIVWHKEQCDRCNRISGSYYEGVVQIRAQDRSPNSYEIQMAAGIADEVEKSLQTSGERLSFVSDITETGDGLDIVVGSQHTGLLISQKITAGLGGRFTTHPKLIGERDGRKLYRITYSVRLPKYQKRDVIRYGGTYGEVIQVKPRHLRVFDFSDGIIRSVREDKIEKLVGNARNAQDAMVAYTSGNTIGVIDPVTYVTKECFTGTGSDIRAGQLVHILYDGDQVIILR
jgi:nonsense-mediated mRNA decay protein 3